MNPTVGSMKVDKILTQFSIAYRNMNYLAEKLLPSLPVKERTGKFAKYDKSSLRLQDNISRAPGTRARSFEYGVSQGSYACDAKSLEHKVPDEMLRNTDDPYDPKRDAVTFLLDQIWLHQEAALATAMADTGTLSQNTTLSGTTQWSDQANSDPFTNFETAQSTIIGSTGQKPNVAAFGYQAWLKFKSHPDIVDRIKHTGMVSAEQTKKAVAELLEVDEVLVGDAIKNTANQGQSDSLSFVWGKHAWLLHRTTRPTLMLPTFGLTVRDQNRVVDTYRDDSTKSDVIRVEDSYDQVFVDVLEAYLIKNAVA